MIIHAINQVEYITLNCVVHRNLISYGRSGSSYHIQLAFECGGVGAIEVVDTASTSQLGGQTAYVMVGKRLLGQCNGY